MALAVGSTVLNNNLRRALVESGASKVITERVIADPTILITPSVVPLSLSQAAFALSNGYTHGYKTVFSLNAAIAAVAVIASYFMIHHKELIRVDDAK